MTKVEVLEEIIRQKGDCRGINCIYNRCPLGRPYGNGSCSKLEIDNLLTAIEMLANIKTKFEVGDKVRIVIDLKNGSPSYEAFAKKEIHTISKIATSGNYYLEGSDSYIFEDKDLELVKKFNNEDCNDKSIKNISKEDRESFEHPEIKTNKLIKGKKYEVSNYKDFSCSKERIFHEENKDFEFPYNCISVGFLDEYRRKIGISTVYYKYIREIHPKYQEYTEFDPKWIGEIVKYNGELEREIVGFSNNKVILFDNYADSVTIYCNTVSFKELLDNYTDKDNKPFGKEIE